MSGGHGHLDHKRWGREGHGRGGGWWTAGLRSRQEGRVVEAQQTGCSDPWVQSWLHHEHSLRPQKGCSTSLLYFHILIQAGSVIHSPLTHLLIHSEIFLALLLGSWVGN